MTPYNLNAFGVIDDAPKDWEPEVVDLLRVGVPLGLDDSLLKVLEKGLKDFLRGLTGPATNLPTSRRAR